MYDHRSQDWSIGSVVKVGFMQLKVAGITAYGNCTVYIMVDMQGIRWYEFEPHHGLRAIDCPEGYDYRFIGA